MSTSRKNNNKISLFGEMSMMSVTASILLILLVVACVAFYIFMSSSPKKKAYLAKLSLVSSSKPSLPPGAKTTAIAI